jgi:hypothetical protein
MSEVIVPKKRDDPMNGSGIKRDYQGKEKAKRDAHHSSTGGAAAADHPRSACTAMFETFRDELDEHHDRRMRTGKVSRDVTALSKKMYVYLVTFKCT